MQLGRQMVLQNVEDIAKHDIWQLAALGYESSLLLSQQDCGTAMVKELLSSVPGTTLTGLDKSLAKCRRTQTNNEPDFHNDQAYCMLAVNNEG